ncbi:MAG: hypothetical protein ACYSWU_25025, partial [Planctomycetota bacterium]
MNTSGSAKEAAALEIGSRLELFVDNYTIDRLEGTRLKLHTPIPRQAALEFDAPWEGPSSAYVTVMKDEDRYRMYYRGSGWGNGQRACYAESEDGITFTRPSLGIVEFQGTRHNNIIWTGEGEPSRSKDTGHNFVAFKDANPDAPQEERYKAVAGGPVVGFASPDGIHWRKIQEEPIIFPYAKCERRVDYISLAFWDVEQGQYVAYLRGWRKSPFTVTQYEEGPIDTDEMFRQVMRSTSADFIHWTEPRFIDLGDTPLEHLYTNATTPYFRAPHIYLAFPRRFVPGRTKYEEHPQPGVSDAVLMSSRDGVHFDRTFMEAFLRRGLDPKNWTDRDGTPAWGVVPTGSEEISLYICEHLRYPTHRLRRFTLRTDGFVSVNARYAGGEMVTKPLTFAGRKLVINYATSAVGSVGVEVQDAEG